MAKRLYVGGLPYSATEQDLENLFASAGTFSSAVVVTGGTTLPRRTGYRDEPIGPTLAW